MILQIEETGVLSGHYHDRLPVDGGRDTTVILPVVHKKQTRVI